MWSEAIEAKFDGKGKPNGRAEFEALPEHCRRVPAILLLDELIQVYPQSKVMLT